MPRTFAQLLQDAMVGRRQSDVARELGMTQAQVSRWVRGEGLPKDEFIPKIAEFLGLDPKALQRRIVKERGTYSKPRRPRDRFAEVEAKLAAIELALRALVEEIREQRLPQDGSSSPNPRKPVTAAD